MEKMKEILKKEFVNGRTMFDYIFLAFGLFLQVLGIIAAYKAGDEYLLVTAISGITGVISVVLCAQGKISFYIFGYIQLFTYVFGVAIPCALWGELLENIFYIATMIWGNIVWIKLYKQNKKKDETIVKAKKFKLVHYIAYFGALIIGTFGMTYFLEYVHILMPAIFPVPDPKPFLDSLTTVAPLIGQILMCLGYREQWIFWVFEDIVSTVMFIALGNWIMVAQYVFWTINCVYGWINWDRLAKEDNKKELVNNVNEEKEETLNKNLVENI